MALDRDELKKLLKEKGVKSLDDLDAFMREISKEVVGTLLDGKLTDHLGVDLPPQGLGNDISEGAEPEGNAGNLAKRRQLNYHEGRNP